MNSGDLKSFQELSLSSDYSIAIQCKVQREQPPGIIWKLVRNGE